MEKSALQIARAAYQPKLPKALQGPVKVKEGAATQSVGNQEEIKAAYRKMVLRYHPDINNKNEETEERVKAINYVDDWQDNESNNLVPR